MERSRRVCMLQDSHVTIECTIPQKYHRAVVGLRGGRVQDVCREHNVNIKFPDRPRPNNNGAPGANGPEDDHVDAGVNGNGPAAAEEDAAVAGGKTKSPDSIFITGKPADCEAAKEALLVSTCCCVGSLLRIFLFTSV